MAKIKVIAISPSGTIADIEIENDLDGLKQSIGGGYIQTIPLDDKGVVGMFDEEGKLNRLPINDVATRYCHTIGCIDPRDYVVGDFVILATKGEFFVSLGVLQALNIKEQL